MATPDEQLLTPAYWESSETDLRLNPKIRQDFDLPPTSGDVIFATSGSTVGPKLVCLSRAALLASAKAVNEHLQVTANDRWLCALPTFHVGGFGIWARGYLSKSTVLTAPVKWNPVKFSGLCAAEKITLTSLVPTQVFDLVQAKLRCPRTIRAVIVGGGALDDELGNQAREMGWPVLQSYGMTEAGSQIATQPLEALVSPFGNSPIDVLPCWEIRANLDDRFEISGPALFRGYAGEAEQSNWFLTDDFGSVEGRKVTVLGRDSRTIKILGELVNLDRLEVVLRRLAGEKAPHVALTNRPDPRAGQKIALVAEAPMGESDVRELVMQFAEQVTPFEQIQETILVEKLPRSSLGKVLHADIP